MYWGKGGGSSESVLPHNLHRNMSDLRGTETSETAFSHVGLYTPYFAPFCHVISQQSLSLHFPTYPSYEKAVSPVSPEIL